MITLNELISEFKKDWRKIPNIITLVRFGLGFFPAIFLVLDLYFPALVIFVFLALTDWFDGYIARSKGLTTFIGRIIDPIADRTMMGFTLLVLITRTPVWISLPLVWFMISAVLIGIVIVGAYRRGIRAKPNMAGKIKTVSLSVLVGCLIGCQISSLAFLCNIVPILLVITLFFSVISFFWYVIEYLL